MCFADTLMLILFCFAMYLAIGILNAAIWCRIWNIPDDDCDSHWIICAIWLPLDLAYLVAAIVLGATVIKDEILSCKSNNKRRI